MNIAIIFAGGTGKRMNTKAVPKQFLELHGKPVIIYTLEQFENHPEIDQIILVCLSSWIDYAKKLLRKFQITKVTSVVPGGLSGQESIFHGIDTAYRQSQDKKDIVLIHDGVRPMINQETITKCLSCVKKMVMLLLQLLLLKLSLLTVTMVRSEKFLIVLIVLWQELHNAFICRIFTELILKHNQSSAMILSIQLC